MSMNMFRKLYYKLTTLFCFFATFSALFNLEEAGIGYACLYIFVGVLCFGTLPVGKREFNPKKPVRNILLLLVWALLGFGIMAVGIACLIDKPENISVLSLFLILPGFGLLIAYIVSIIITKDLFAILSVVLAIGGILLGSYSNGALLLQILTLLMLFSALACFVISVIKGIIADD